MGTTSPSKLPQALDAFFRDRVVPLRVRLRRGGPLFPLRPDPAASSYYLPRGKTRMDPADFERLGPRSAETLAADLVRLWTETGRPELVALAPAIAELARAARHVETEEEAEVSQFVYAMY